MTSREQLVEDYGMIACLNGLYVGQLDERELKALNRLKSAGLAARSYSSAVGFFGVAKVRILPWREPFAEAAAKAEASGGFNR